METAKVVLEAKKEPQSIPNIKTIQTAEKQLKKRGIKWDKTQKTQEGALFQKSKKDVAVWFKEDDVLLIFEKVIHADEFYQHRDFLKSGFIKEYDIETVDEAKNVLKENYHFEIVNNRNIAGVEYFHNSDRVAAAYGLQENVLMIDTIPLACFSEKAVSPEAQKVVVSVEFLQDTPNVKSIDKILAKIRADKVTQKNNVLSISMKGNPAAILKQIVANAELNDIAINATNMGEKV